MTSSVPKTSSKITSSATTLPPDNAVIAELLAREAEQMSGHLQRAYKRAARAAFLWPEEAAQLAAQGQGLTQLPGIGPYLERVLQGWFKDPPQRIEAPPLRRGFLTLAQARRLLRSAPSWRERYRGDLQMHSHWSDGAGTIAQLADAARARNYEYIAITDHSKGLKIAGGINEKELIEQGREIKALNSKLRRRGNGFHVLRSIELNMNPRGEADLEPATLKGLDLVVGSFHSRLREQEDQTHRYLAALTNPSVNILGHPRGRIYNHRLGLRADWPRVFACAARLDKAVELDCYPDRQDLDVELLRIARGEGARVAIDTDAHSPEQLAFIDLGLAGALLADIPEDRIVNFMSAEMLQSWARRES